MGKVRETMSREAKAASREIERGLHRLSKSIAKIQAGLGATERKIESDARTRIRKLRKDAKSQLAVLQARRREASRTVERLSVAAGGSWRDIKQAADRALADARTTAEAMVARFRRALPR